MRMGLTPLSSRSVTPLALAITALIGVVAQGEEKRNLIENPGFEKGLEGWSTNSGKVRFEAAEEDGRRVGRITVPDQARVGYPYFHQDLQVTPGSIHQGRMQAKVHDLRNSAGGAYALLEYLSRDGKRVSLSAAAHVTEQDRWSDLRFRGVVPEGAVTMRISLILNGRGVAYFDDVELIRISACESDAPFDGQVQLTVTDDIVCQNLIGFGGEDDGWFFNAMNKYRDESKTQVRITPAEYATNIGRLEWLDPDYVRMFVWAKDWCPTGDWRTFTWNTDNMKSRYKTLDIYQRLQATVNVTGVEWGMPAQMFHGDPEPLARAFGELLEHLIRRKGYTCVKQWTLTNEPNGAFSKMGGTFDFYVRIHQLVREEVKRRGLNVSIVGSDDAQDIDWFRRCVESDAYFEAVDLFASHRYFRESQRGLIPLYYEDRLETLARRATSKPLVIGEFGFQDERSEVIKNPIMVEYEYAPWTVAFVIDGLNRGVAGYNIWTLHDMIYSSGGLMTYGLWAFEGDDWAVRPVYHAMGMFTRLTEAGDSVRRCQSSQAGRVKAAFVGNTLFWVNLGQEPAAVTVHGCAAREVRVMEKKTLQGDRHCGVVLKLNSPPRFTAPPASFGYAR